MTLFADIGAALYGTGGNVARVKLARVLQIDYRTIERFWSGDMEPQAGVWLELAELLDKRLADLKTQATQRASECAKR